MMRTTDNQIYVDKYGDVELDEVFYVIVQASGRVMPQNDEDQSPVLCKSKAHALRVIKWIEMKGCTVRKATIEEMAEGVYDTVKAKP